MRGMPIFTVFSDPLPLLIVSLLRNNKISEYQSISIHLTTHRLVLIPDPSLPSSSTSRPPPSLQTSLNNVRQTEFYTGFMRSSPKITMFLGRAISSTPNDVELETDWTCEVCGYVNVISSNDSGPAGGMKCRLCGVASSSSRTSSSLSSTRIGSPKPVTSSPNPDVGIPEDPEGRLACPSCTFLNHRSMAFCEICSSPLPGAKKVSAPTKLVDGLVQERSDVVRLSFRKGGEKDAYRKMKVVLGMKAWERVVSYQSVQGWRVNAQTNRMGDRRRDIARTHTLAR